MATADDAATRNEQLEMIERQSQALEIALLKGAAADVESSALPSKHLAEYELLCRAWAQR